MRHAHIRRIALAFPMGMAFTERLLQGILEHARKRGGWVFTRTPERLTPSVDWLVHWRGDGAFALVTTPADARIARKLRMPVVNLAAYLADPGVPTVMMDHPAIGRLAATHLLERRFQRFGYYGTRGVWYSEQRRASFVEAVRKAGCRCDVLEVQVGGRGRKWLDEQQQLEHWLRKLQAPVGIMASTDLRATMVLDACNRLGLRVPEDVALVGVDNDPVACEFSQPPLSSVARDDHELGRRAAVLLEQLMNGSATPKKPILISPRGVVARRSTETLAIEDAHVAAAVRDIREHLKEQFGVERLLESSSISRRRLEHRFRESLGCTPYTLITRLRVERAKELLSAAKKRSLTEIARECGFSDLRRLRLVFRRLAGCSPAEYQAALDARER